MEQVPGQKKENSAVSPKEKIEEALVSGDLDNAESLLRKWNSDEIEKYGFGVPDSVQSEQRELSGRIQKARHEIRAKTALAERKAKWMAPEVNWSNGPGSRGRQARLLVRNPNGTLSWFSGADVRMEGLEVVNSRHVKDGKWSRTEYRLKVQPGFAAISMNDGFDSGRTLGGLGVAVGLSEMATASEIAEVLQVAPEEVERLRASGK